MGCWCELLKTVIGIHINAGTRINILKNNVDLCDVYIAKIKDVRC